MPDRCCERVNPNRMIGGQIPRLIQSIVCHIAGTCRFPPYEALSPFRAEFLKPLITGTMSVMSILKNAPFNEELNTVMPILSRLEGVQYSL